MVKRPHLLLLAAMGLLTHCRAGGEEQRPKASASVSAPDRANAISPVRWKQRSPSKIRKAGNHLRGAQSLYLRQHAHNPVEWYPWGPEALGRARDENKPIFLSIGYSSCHWCHVMEKNVFEHDDVAALLNQNFVCIKVDREERPDLDKVYMNALVRMTRGGGWPMSMFLLPDLRPFWGGTYLPRRRFLAVARRLSKKFRTARAEADADAARFAAGAVSVPTFSPGAPLDAAVLDEAARRASWAFDERWGGLRTRQKFPTPVWWRYLLRRYRKTGRPRYAQMVRRTLDAMASGGIHDHIGGGFHRYSVEPTWVVPHFEKMLYDNTQLASLYLEAYAALGTLRYAEVARDILDFLLRRMRNLDGTLAASYDADSGHGEGSFYVWTPAEIEKVAGSRAGPALAMLLGVTASGNFEGKSIPTRRVSPEQVARKLGWPASKVHDLFLRWRPALRAHRAKRISPALDRKVVTGWNGLAIAALAQGALVFGEARYRIAAERAADRIWDEHHRGGGRLYRASNHGVARHEAVLDDYAFLAGGLLDLFQATGRERHLRRGLSLIQYAAKHFRHPEAGFYFTAQEQVVPLGRATEPYDSVRPSGLSALLDALLRAAMLTGNAAYREEVERSLRGYAGILARSGLDLSGSLDVAQRFLGPSYEVVIAGAPEDPRTQALVSAFAGLFPSHAVLVRVPASGPTPAVTRLLPPAEGKRALGGVPTAFVCQFRRCKLPTKDPAVMKQQLLSGWKQ